MAISNQDTEVREFLQRVKIRTMKKDLARVREADSLKEREKIGKIKVTKEPVNIDSQDGADKNTISDVPTPVKVPTPPMPMVDDTDPLAKIPSQLENILPSPPQKKVPIITNQSTQENQAKEKVKQFATEPEKQQIFLLESQRLTLARQLQPDNTKINPRLTSEKNKLAAEQKNLQKRLAPLVARAEENETKEKSIEDREATADNSVQKQSLAKEKSALEEQKQRINTERWFVEKELVKLEEKMAELNENYHQFTGHERSIKEDMATIDGKLRSIYHSIIEREKAKKRAEAATLKKEPEPTTHDHKPNMREAIELPLSENQEPEKEYLKGVPPATKEKLTKSAATEEKQRKKFIEDVEKWAQKIKGENSSN
jgi:hypothetical protein